MKNFTFLTFFFCFQQIIAQNLVLNPSFEDYKYCPEFISNFNNNVTNWSTPNMATTDYFNLCSDKFKRINHAGFQKPRSGKGYAGMYFFTKDKYKEYAQGKLVNTLVKDTKYNITFYVSLADYSTHALKNIDVLFVPEKLRIHEDESAISLKRVLKKTGQGQFAKTTKEHFYTNKDSWTKVTIDYTAKGFEKYFIIGNFERNKKVKKDYVLKSRGKKFSYY